jgi:hypothetical protein
MVLRVGPSIRSGGAISFVFSFPGALQRAARRPVLKRKKRAPVAEAAE